MSCMCSLFRLAVQVSNVIGLSVFVGLKLEIIYFFVCLLVGVGHSSFIHFKLIFVEVLLAQKKCLSERQ